MDASFERLTRRLGWRTAVATSLAAFALRAPDHVASGQSTPSPAATGSAAEGEKPVFMFVQTAASGRGEIVVPVTPVADSSPTPWWFGFGAPFLLTLEAHTGLTIYFSDRPDRIVGAVPTWDVLNNLGFDRDNPPNAVLVAEFETGQGVVVLELLSPDYDAETGTLLYAANVLEGYQGENLTPVLAEQVAERLPAEFGPAALFIDSDYYIVK